MVKLSTTPPATALPAATEPTGASPPLSEGAGTHLALFRHYEEALALMADIERMEHSRAPVEMDTVKRLYDRLHLAVQKMLVALGDLGDLRSETLLKMLQQFARQTTPLFDPALSIPAHPILADLSDVRPEMAPFVGHKAANLAAIGHSIGLPVPEGFVLTARAFDCFMAENDLFGLIEAYLHGMDGDQSGPIHERCEIIRRLILQAPVPAAVEDAVSDRLERWRRERGIPIFTAVRSTAVGEDTEISFAGQFATLLNVPPASVLTAYKEVIASKYSVGAILYRLRYGLDDRATPMAVLFMEMIPAMASGVVYTRHPSQPDRDDLHISAIHGLGEYLMSGDVAPHVFSVDRRSGDVQIRHAARQSHWMTGCPGGGTRLAPVPSDKVGQPPVDAVAARRLAAWGARLERHFGAPQDLEWALDARGRLFLLQSRPLGLDGPPAAESEGLQTLETLTVLHKGGRTACSGMVAGRLRRIAQEASDTVAADSILVIPKAAPEYAPLIGRVRGVIAARGSAASHLASVAREFGVPMIVDSGPIDDRWPDGVRVILHADTASVYRGEIDLRTTQPIPQAFAHPMETPLRRRLRALSNRIVPRRGSLALDPSGNTSPPSLHDLLHQAHGFAMETLQAHPPKVEAPLQIIRWTAENAAADFALACGEGTDCPPEAIPKVGGTGRGDAFLQALWTGMAGSNSRSGQTPLLQVDGWALLADNAMHAIVNMGEQQAIVEARRPDQTTVDFRLRISGGDGPFYDRCLRTVCLAVILEEMGFTARINGALLDASAKAEGTPRSGTLLTQIGRLLVFSRENGRQLVGPWAVGHLKKAFWAGQALAEDDSAASLPSAMVPLAGNWRRATLDGCAVIIHDGPAVGNWTLPALKTVAGDRRRDYRFFFEQLHRDYFLPQAVAEDSHMGDGQIDLSFNLLGGQHACAGGVVFGFGDPGRFFIAGLDAHRKRLVLYETIHGRRFKRLRKRYPAHTDRWYDISLRISALTVQIHIDGVPLMAYTADGPIAGRAGLWAWDDTMAVFERLTFMAGTRRRLTV